MDLGSIVSSAAQGFGMGGVPGAVIGGALGLVGAQQQNDTQQANFSAANSFNAEEAEKNRFFQGQQAAQAMSFAERMSNTSL